MNTKYTDEQKMTTAKRLMALRKDKKISHVTLSRELYEKYGLRISKDSLMKYEVSEINHSSFGATKGMAAETLYCLASFYGVSTDFLLGKTDIRDTSIEMQAVCKFMGLSEQAVNAIRNLDKTKDPFYGETMGYTPPLAETFNALCENGFTADLTQAFGHFLYNVVVSNGIEDGGLFLSIEDRETKVLPAFIRMNKEIEKSVERVEGKMLLELSHLYAGWENP